MNDDAPPAMAPGSQAGYVDIDRLANSDRIVAVFSQRRWDGEITFAIFREFDKFERGQVVVSRTGFIPASLSESYQSHVQLAIAHIGTLAQRRRERKLPFPEGGEQRGRR